MGLEASPTYISDLNSAWPLGTDVKSAGDDHLRNIKSTLLTTFPGITGAVTATHTNLNGAAAIYAADAGAAGMVSDIAALGDPGGDRVLGWDDSAGSVINFQLGGALSTSGFTLQATAADILTQLLTVDGSGCTLDADLLDGQHGSFYTNASNLGSGSVPDARLGNAARVNAANIFSGFTQRIHGASEALRITDSSGFISFYNSDNDTRSAYISGATSGLEINVNLNQALSVATNNTERLNISGAGNFNFKTGTALFGATVTVSAGGASITGNSTITGTLGGLTGLTVASGGASITGDLTTPNTSAAEVGFKGLPQNVQNGDYTFVLTDAGKSVDKQSGGAGETYTIPANASVAFPIGSVLCGDNDGGGTLTIAITSDTLEDTLGNTGSRTVADNGQWHAKKIASTKWRITGAGIS